MLLAFLDVLMPVLEEALFTFFNIIRHQLLKVDVNLGEVEFPFLRFAHVLALPRSL